jgi:Na+/melibiose symporter-like transporter
MFTADCIELRSVINKERSEGIAFSVQTFITKLSEACLFSTLPVALGVAGYKEMAEVQRENSSWYDLVFDDNCTDSRVPYYEYSNVFLQT